MLITRYLSVEVTKLNGACSQKRQENICSLTYNLTRFHIVKWQLLIC